jgi:hypothetical protein
MLCMWGFILPEMFRLISLRQLQIKCIKIELVNAKIHEKQEARIKY